jgi:hypothetical protein
MTRVFTLQFPFRNTICTALVSIKDSGYNLTCFVRYISKELLQIIPDGKLIFQLTGEFFCSTNIETDQAQELIFCTSNAIAEHLKTDGQRLSY